MISTKNDSCSVELPSVTQFYLQYEHAQVGGIIADECEDQINNLPPTRELPQLSLLTHRNGCPWCKVLILIYDTL